MVFRLVVPLATALAFFLFLGYLNPDQVTFRYALGGNRFITLPLLVLLLLAGFAGAFMLGVFLSLGSVGDYFKNISSKFGSKRKEKQAKNLEVAKKQIEAGKLQKALKITRRLLSQDKKNLGALILKGNILRDTGKFQEALDTHSYALACNPSNEEVIIQLKDDYLSAGHPDAAYKMLEKVRGRDPRNIEIMIQMRDISFKQSEMKRTYMLQKEIINNIKDKKTLAVERERLAKFHAISATKEVKKGDIKMAKNEIHSSLWASPNFIPAILMSCDIALWENNKNEAKKILKSGFRQTFALPLLQRIEELLREDGEELEIPKLYHWAGNLMGDDKTAKYLLFFLIKAELDQWNLHDADETLKLAGRHFSQTTLFNLARGIVDMGDDGDSMHSTQSFKKAFDIEWKEFLSYNCQKCGYSFSKYFPACPVCMEWNSAKPTFKPVAKEENGESLLKV